MADELNEPESDDAGGNYAGAFLSAVQAINERFTTVKYRNPPSYVPVEKLVEKFAQSVAQYMFVFGSPPVDRGPDYEHAESDARLLERESREFYFISRARDFDLPIFWLSSDLAAAADRTEVPSDVWLRNLKWPREVALFMLPEGIVTVREDRHSDDHGNYAVEWTLLSAGLCRVHANESVEPPIWIDVPPDVRQRLTITYAEDGVVALSVIRGRYMRDRGGEGPFYHTYTAWLPFDIRADEIDRTIPIRDFEPDAADEDTDDPWQELVSMLNVRARRIAVNAILMLQARPELLEPRAKIKTIKDKRRGRVTLWEPRWVGRKFTVQKEAPTATHASPRMHWRNGHWRNQPYGPQAELRKLIWIEPTLVAAVIH